MANLRIISDNAADRATIVASSTAGAYGVANLKNELKGVPHRSGGTSVSFTLTWPNFQSVGGVAIPACNLTADATIRVRAWNAESGGTLLADTGNLFACPGANAGDPDWTVPLNANAFAFGGASKAVAFLNDHYAVKRVQIDLVDTLNAAGFIDCARLVVGGYWEPLYNANYGAQNNVVDTSQSARNDSGDLLPDRGTQHETITLDLQYMPEADRAKLNRLMRRNGTHRNLFLCLYPVTDGDTDPVLQQDNMIYGQRQNSGIAIEYFNAHTAQITIEGW